MFKTQFKLKKIENEKNEKFRTDKTDERVNKLYNDEFKKTEKIKELAKKHEKIQNTEFDCLIYSNRLILGKFNLQFYQEITNIEKNCVNGPITKLTLMQICKTNILKI